MEVFSSFRQFIYSFRRKYRKYRKRKSARSDAFIEGLPLGMTPDLLDEVCLRYFNVRPQSFSSQHLSGWKPSGAYRLRIRTQHGSDIHLILKESYYTTDHIPALEKLPVRPGPPEYMIYSQPVGALASYLPNIYLAQELVPGTHYRFLMEDLAQEYHRVYDTDEIFRASAMIPSLHQALNEWANETNPQKMVHYGKGASQALEEYARDNLEKYSEYSKDSSIKAVLSCWPKISSAYLSPEFLELQPARPIHGDTNYSNVHIHNRDPLRFKLVDWEWAGYGFPHADLASLLKGVPEEMEKRALQMFIGSSKNPNPCLSPGLTLKDNQRIYHWCQLERSLLDAAFLTNQHLNSSYTTFFSLPETINRSLRQILSAYKKLGA
jgi:hypothetical protein